MRTWALKQMEYANLVTGLDVIPSMSQEVLAVLEKKIIEFQNEQRAQGLSKKDDAQFIEYFMKIMETSMMESQRVVELMSYLEDPKLRKIKDAPQIPYTSATWFYLGALSGLVLGTVVWAYKAKNNLNFFNQYF